MEANARELVVVDLPALRVVAVERLATAAEGLQHADALGGFLDGGREVAGLVLDAADDLVVRALEAAAEDHDGHRRREGDERERHVEHHQHREDRGHLERDQDEEDGAEADEAPDDREVARRARQQLTRVPPVVEADVEALEVRVEVVAQRGLQLGRDGGQQDAATEGEHDLEHREGRREQAPPNDAGAVAVTQRTVDDGRDDQG